jgi:hypothetical protein
MDVAQVDEPEPSAHLGTRFGKRYRRRWKRGLRAARFADASEICGRTLPPVPALIPSPAARGAEYGPHEIAASLSEAAWLRPHGCNCPPATRHRAQFSTLFREPRTDHHLKPAADHALADKARPRATERTFGPRAADPARVRSNRAFPQVSGDCRQSLERVLIFTGRRGGGRVADRDHGGAACASGFGLSAARRSQGGGPLGGLHPR